MYHQRGKKVHGYFARKHPNYAIWSGIKSRCLNPKSRCFANYGGRGITVCDEWSESFERFALDMGLRPSPNHTIDRIDNNKGYSKDNCRWSTRTDQCLNRRRFRNNTSGLTGVVGLGNGSFSARYDHQGVRYNLGRFSTRDDAERFRLKFIGVFRRDREKALSMIERRARLDSSTKIRGITKNAQGYIVRVTLPTGERRYVGFSKDLEGAKRKLNRFNREVAS